MMRLLAVSHACILNINRQLFMELAHRGFTVRIVVPARWKNDYGARSLQPEALPINAPHTISLHAFSTLRIRDGVFYATVLGSYHRLLRWKPAVIFLDEEPWSPIATQWALYAWLAQASLILYTKDNLPRAYPLPLRWMRRFVLDRAARILTISEDATSVLEERYRRKCMVFPHAIDPTLFYPDPTARAENDGSFHIGFVGRITPAKGMATLLQAAAMLAPLSDIGRIPIVHIYGAGDASYEAELRDQQRHLGLPPDRVVWHGPIAHEDVPAAMRTLDLLVVPTVSFKGYKEQFGRVAIEALACGIPIVTSNNGELPILVRKTKGGLAFSEGDAKELATCIARLMDSPALRAEAALSGLSYIQQQYSYDVLVDRFELILTSITSRKSGS